MSTYDKSRCLANIYYLAKERNEKIGDLEAAAGVSAGYFSRLKNEESKGSPAIEVLFAVADKLKVTVDALINFPFADTTPSEQYLIKFIDRLTSETTEFSQYWECESLSSLNNIGFDMNGDANHRLFTVRDLNTIDRTTGYPDGRLGVFYNSSFYPEQYAKPSGNFYKTSLRTYENTILAQEIYITKASVLENDSSVSFECYELYLVVGAKVSPLCHAILKSDSPFLKPLELLYSMAIESSRHPRISAEVKSAIDAFMNVSDLPF